MMRSGHAVACCGGTCTGAWSSTCAATGTAKPHMATVAKRNEKFNQASVLQKPPSDFMFQSKVSWASVYFIGDTSR